MITFLISDQFLSSCSFMAVVEIDGNDSTDDRRFDLSNTFQDRVNLRILKQDQENFTAQNQNSTVEEVFSFLGEHNKKKILSFLKKNINFSISGHNSESLFSKIQDSRKNLKIVENYNIIEVEFIG
jgi:hypothetical protein